MCFQVLQIYFQPVLVYIIDESFHKRNLRARKATLVVVLSFHGVSALDSFKTLQTETIGGLLRIWYGYLHP